MNNSKRVLTILLFMMILFAIPAGQVIADPANCKEPLPRIFERVSKSVVLIPAVSLDRFSLHDRIKVSMGSGFIIRKDDLILTNSHVVFGKQAISVSLDNHQVFQAQLIGADPIMDLAVLKIDVEKKT